MSYIKQSDSDSDDDEDDLSSTESLTDVNSGQQPLQIEDVSTPENKIPLSTSIILDKLPQKDQDKLHEKSDTTTKEPIKKNLDKEEPSQPTKINIRFQSIGSTTQIEPKVFKISSTQTISTIQKFLCKKLKTKNLHLYLQNSFAPNPDEKINELYNLFKTNNELIISYCNTIAFG
ncbi:ATG12 [Candida jiufengensis]|uniref:ATG12 n=1 Tax=Candida jiufengensis TaxID=497108 RepID=UPI00222572AF|nr:ATG12 [Candida jiufengensis]KAI5954598.1 ATG12 [Candida jiufengensis]